MDQEENERKMVKVSVIAAVYNVEKYLDKCVNSILCQTLSDIELILINDGSTDGSQQIIDSWMQKTDKIQCVQCQNGGAAKARNAGLSLAKGKYIGYVDSDDFVDADMYEIMYQKAEKENAEIVECNLRHTYESSEDVEVMEQLFTKSELLTFGRYVVWNKIYKREWLLEHQAFFPEGVIYEDVAFVADLVPYISSYAYVDIAPVHYVQRNSSVNHSTDLRTLDILKVMDYIFIFYQKNNFFKMYQKELEYLTTRIILCSSFSRICKMSHRASRRHALQENYAYLEQHFPKWKKNSILKAQKSHQALFMKSINPCTYKIFSALLPFLYSMKGKITRKWN